MLLHDRARGYGVGLRGGVPGAREVGLLEVGEPLEDFCGWGRGEEEADLAFYLLEGGNCQ